MDYLNLFYAALMSFITLSIILLVRDSLLRPVSSQNITVILRAGKSLGQLEHNLKFLKSIRNDKRFNAQIIIDISGASDECIAASQLLASKEDQIKISELNSNKF